MLEEMIDFQSEVSNDKSLLNKEGHSSAGEEFENANGEPGDAGEPEENKKKWGRSRKVKRRRNQIFHLIQCRYEQSQMKKKKIGK